MSDLPLLPDGYEYTGPKRTRNGSAPRVHIAGTDPRFGFLDRSAICGSTPATGFSGLDQTYKAADVADLCPRCVVKMAKLTDTR